MVEVNFGRLRPTALLDLSHVDELQDVGQRRRTRLRRGGHDVRADRARAHRVPAARRGRSLGRRPRRSETGRRSAATSATASPAGDSIPVLAAYGRRRRDSPRWPAGRGDPARRSSSSGPSRRAFGPDELIVGVEWQPVTGPGSFAKVGRRNAMVIAIASVCLQVDERAPWRPRRARLGGTDGACARTSAEALRGGVAGRARPAARTRRGVRPARGRRRRRPIDDLRGTRPSTAATSWTCSHAARSARPRTEAMLIRRTVNGVERARRRGAGDEPARAAPRRPRPHRHEERVRAGRVRVVLGLARRRARVRVPRSGRAGRRHMTCARSRRSPRTTGSTRCRTRSSTAGAVQCGFCTPGLVVAAADLLEREPAPRATARSARRSPATSAAAPGTRRSSTRYASRPAAEVSDRRRARRSRRERVAASTASPR